MTDRCLRQRCPVKMVARFEWRGAGSQQIGDFVANSAPVAECRSHISLELVFHQRFVTPDPTTSEPKTFPPREFQSDEAIS